MWCFVQFVYCFCTKCTIVCVVFVVFLKEGDNIDACQKLLDITFSLVYI